MKRVWAAGAILVVVLGLSIAGLSFSNHIISDMRGEIEQVQQALESDRLDEAKEHSEELLRLWREHYALLCTYIQHSKLEQVDQSLSVLAPQLKYEDFPQLASELGRAYSQLEHLKDTEFPKLENIL